MTEQAKVPLISTAPPAVGGAIVRGMAWAMTASIAVKLSGLVVQIALGWLLLPGDFRIYAIALSLTIVTTALTNGGMQKLLIQQPHRLRELAGSARLVAWIFNIAGAAILLAAAMPAARWFDAEGIEVVMLLLALNMVARTPVALAEARLRVDLRFAAISQVEMVAVTLRAVATVALATLGAGAISLVLPFVLLAPIEATMLRRRGGTIPGESKASTATIGHLLRPGLWIMLSAGAAGLVTRGDYLVISWLASPIVGVYFFGFQLAMSALQLFLSGLGSILLPGFGRVASDPERLRAAARRAVTIATLLLAPACVCIAIAAPWFMHIAWAGRWDEAIAVTQLVALSTIFRVSSPVAYALLEANGRWSWTTTWNLVEGLSLMGSTALAIHLAGPDLVVVAIVVGAQRALCGLGILALASRSMGHGSSDLLRAAAVSIAPTISGIVPVLALSLALPEPRLSFLSTLASITVFLAGFTTTALLAGRRGVLDAVSMAAHLRPRRSDGGPQTTDLHISA